MFDIIQAKSKDTDKFSPTFFQILDGDLMPLFQEEFTCFQGPNESQSQDENQGIDPFQFSQVCILKIEASTFARTEKDFDAPALRIKWSAMSQTVIANQNQILL